MWDILPLDFAIMLRGQQCQADCRSRATSIRGASSHRKISRNKKLVVPLLQLLPVTVTSILLFTPLFLGLGPRIESTPASSFVIHVIGEKGLSYMTVAALAILLPVLIDNVFDFVYFGPSASLINRTYFLSMLFLTFLVEFLTLEYFHLSTIYCSAYSTQIWILVYISLMELHRISIIFSWQTIIAVLTLFYAYFTTFVWFFTYGGDALFTAVAVLKYSAFGLLFIVFLVYIGIEIVTLWKSRKTLTAWFSDLENKTQHGLTVSIGVFITLFIYLILGLTLNSVPGFFNFTSQYLYGYLTLCIICSVFITVLPQRLMKIYALKMNADLELKKTFVRYISHELRTPLSIALSGIDLLEEQLREGAGVNDLLSTTMDIRSPCRTGVEILNELLDFEKLDSGLTVMDKTAQDPVVFVQATLTPFNLVARQKNIDLRVTSQLQPAHFTVDIDETKVIAACLPIIAVTLVTIGFAGVPQYPLERL